jgi:hypothetical protein
MAAALFVAEYATTPMEQAISGLVPDFAGKARLSCGQRATWRFDRTRPLTNSARHDINSWLEWPPQCLELA